MTSILDLINFKGFIDENISGKKRKMKEKMAYVAKIKHQKVITQQSIQMCVDHSQQHAWPNTGIMLYLLMIFLINAGSFSCRRKI